MADPWAVAVAALVGLTPFVAGRLRHPSSAPRSRWLSFAGGVALAFVFLDLLPALAEGAPEDDGGGTLALLGPYLVALAGFALYYGVEHAVRRHADPESPAQGAFWISVVSFSALSFVAAYLLVRPERSPPALLLFAAAIALKLFVSDRSLHERHRRAYERIGRWLLFAAFAAGALVAVFAAAPAAIRTLQAFLAGGLLLTVVKEELPSERAARWSAFAVGAAVYAALFVGARLLA